MLALFYCEMRYCFLLLLDVQLAQLQMSSPSHELEVIFLSGSTRQDKEDNILLMKTDMR